MRIPFVRSWKLVALRGVAALLFAFVMFLRSEVTLPELVVLFGVFAIVDGALAVAAGARLGSADVKWLLEGALGMAVGWIALLCFGIALPSLVRIVAFWALLTALLELSAALRVRDGIPGELSLVFAGMGSLILGAVLLFWPNANPVGFTVMLGYYALIFGASMLTLAYQLRKAAKRLEPPRAQTWRAV